MSLLTRLIAKFRTSVHGEPPQIAAKILDNSAPSNPQPGIPDKATKSETDSSGWRTSSAHLFLLSKFTGGYIVEQFAKDTYLTKPLGEPPSVAIERFVREGVLLPAGLAETLACKYRASDLSDLLEKLGLPHSGSKKGLAARLAKRNPEVARTATSGITCLKCSEEGEQLARQYILKERNRREHCELEVFRALTEGRLRDAAVLVQQFEASQVTPRGLNVDWTRHDPNNEVEMLKLIYEHVPKILRSLPQNKLEALRPAAAAMFLWGTNTARNYLAPDLATGLKMDPNAAARMFLFYASHLRELDSYRRAGVKSVRVLATDDSCSPCKQLATREYAISHLPELPYDKCSSQMGCRCVATAVL